LFRAIDQSYPKRLVFRFNKRTLEFFGSCKPTRGFAKMQAADLSDARTVEEAAVVMFALPCFFSQNASIACSPAVCHHSAA
jgi:hypothetical protein